MLLFDSVYSDSVYSACLSCSLWVYFGLHMSFLVHRDLHPLLVSVVASTYLGADVGFVVGLVFF